MSDKTPEYLTPEQVAERLQLHTESVNRMLREGKLPGTKIGGRWRVHSESLDRLVRGDADPTPNDTAA